MLFVSFQYLAKNNDVCGYYQYFGCEIIDRPAPKTEEDIELLTTIINGLTEQKQGFDSVSATILNFKEC